ncbi:MAG: hypothetical protein KGI71_03050 [Patescibacteria group bacterium]|nr:hypothetical protein [Patescibacteria group bacterium]
MRVTSLYRAIVGLCTGIALCFSMTFNVRAALPDAVKVPTRPAYSENEFKCMALALWHEGGSTFATQEELKLMAHTVIVRSRAKDWYQRRDWGGPDICSVVHKKEHGVCQYSYYCTRHATESPVPGYLWGELKASILSPVGQPTARDLWERAKRAAREVLDGWTPTDEMVRADTYLHKCSTQFAPPDCSPRLVASQVAKCWFALEQVLIPGQSPVPADRKHVYYRRKTFEEVKSSITAAPPECGSSDEDERRRLTHEVSIVHEAQREWIDHPDRPPVVQRPEHEKRGGKKHKRHARHYLHGHQTG